MACSDGRLPSQSGFSLCEGRKSAGQNHHGLYLWCHLKDTMEPLGAFKSILVVVLGFKVWWRLGFSWQSSCMYDSSRGAMDWARTEEGSKSGSNSGEQWSWTQKEAGPLLPQPEKRQPPLGPAFCQLGRPFQMDRNLDILKLKI